MDTLSDDVLIAIFNSYLGEYLPRVLGKERERAWRSLVHVCRRWRSIVFGSPLHLDLELVCDGGTRAKDTLDVWPAFPLVIDCSMIYSKIDAGNIIAVLERRDRVRRIHIDNLMQYQRPIMGIILPAMQQPFPELTHLLLYTDEGTMPIVPESFLGGSAPRLEYLELHRIPIQGLPKLLLSATHLRTLYLENVPHSGYISPDAMVAVLSTMTSLESLRLAFQSPRSCPDLTSRPPPPSTRSVLPVLTKFWFKGVSEYLEDFVDLIDTPQLNRSLITFFNDVVFETPRFIQFITRTPTLIALEKAHITFSDERANVNFLSRTSQPTAMDIKLNVEIICRGLDWQLSFVEQVCTSCFTSLSMAEDLYIYRMRFSGQERRGKIENEHWVELLHPFTGVKKLCLSGGFARHIGPALQELVEGRTTEVLPTLENIYLEGLEPSGSVEEGIGQFVAARQVAGHPMTISHWANKWKETIDPIYRDEY